MPDCSSIQKSLAWCQGRPELPGVKRRIYYISKYSIVNWPQLQHDNNGRLVSATYVGDFTLRADAKWKYIDVIADKSQLTSEPQGEYPSQTQLNKLTAVHPGVEADASSASAYLNNNDNVFLVEDMRGKFRVVGSDKWPTKTTVSQDLGQGPTGTTSTTINVEATDECPAPFYSGMIATDDGTISPSGNQNQSIDDIVDPGYTGNDTIKLYNKVLINGREYVITDENKTNKSKITINGSLTSFKCTGTNIRYVSLEPKNGTDEETEISSDLKTATWSGEIAAPDVVEVSWAEPDGKAYMSHTWFYLTLA